MNSSLLESNPVKTRCDVTVVPPGVGEAWWIVTDRQVMKLSSTQTGGAVSLWFETVPPGGGPPPHVHRREDEVFIITEGEITFLSEDRSWIAPAGAVVFAPRGIPHTFRNCGEKPARFIGLVTPGGFDEYFRETACRWSDSEERPAVQQEEIDRLLRAGPRYGLEFRM